MKSIRSIGLLIAVSLLTACASTFREPTPTPDVVQVSADQIALAMQEDHFFLDYRLKTLQVTGIVAAIIEGNDASVVELKTSIPTVVRCYLSMFADAPEQGAEITVQALASKAQREDDAVGLQNCRIISD
jgi:hypothetical protein